MTGQAKPRRRPEPSPYGPVLAAARHRHGISQQHAAEAIGVSLSTLQSWEQGRRECPPERRAFLAEQWGIDRAELGLDGEEACPCCKRPW